MFRPFKDLPTQLKELTSICAFHAFPSDEETKAHLEVGQFCLKPSNEPGLFSLWGKTKDGVTAKRILHNLGKKEEEKYVHDQHFDTNKQKYPNLIEYLRAAVDKLGTKCCQQSKKKVNVYYEKATPENIYDIGNIKMVEPISTSATEQQSSPEEEEGFFWTVSYQANPGGSYFVILCKDSLLFFDDYDVS